MNEPRQRIGRAGLLAAAVFLLLLAGSLLIRWHDPAPEAPPASDHDPRRDAIAAAKAALPRPPLGRADLINATDEARAAYAAGKAPPQGGMALAGQRFELRLPFGCYGPAPEAAAAAMRWSYDAKAGVLRLSARPEDWTDARWARPLSAGAEAIEGFWLERPWMREETCPVVRGSNWPVLVAGPSETLGLAQIFEPGGSRLNRREGKPYTAAIRRPAEGFSAAGGFRLVLQGRVSRPPGDGEPIVCSSDNPDHPPVCLIVVTIDLVAMETAAGERLAEWPS